MIIVNDAMTTVQAASLSFEPSDQQTLIASIAWREFSEGNREWEEYEVISSELLFDTELQEKGVHLTLQNENHEEGYAIIIEENDDAIVVEMGKGPSPYSEYDGYRKIYVSQLSYLAANPAGTFAIRLDTEELVNLQQAQFDEMHIAYPICEMNVLIDNDPPINPTPSDTVGFLSNYNTWFVQCGQPDGYSCIPTSFAMALKYLNARGIIALYSGMSNIYTMRNTLYTTDYMVDEILHLCRENAISDGFYDFCQDYTNRTMWLDAYWDYDSTYTDVKSEIDINFPVVLMFKDGVLVTCGSAHATTMVGYYENYSYSTGSTNYYVIVCDPNDSGNQKTVLWQASRIYGHYEIMY